MGPFPLYTAKDSITCLPSHSASSLRYSLVGARSEVKILSNNELNHAKLIDMHGWLDDNGKSADPMSGTCDNLPETTSIPDSDSIGSI